MYIRYVCMYILCVYTRLQERHSRVRAHDCVILTNGSRVRIIIIVCREKKEKREKKKKKKRRKKETRNNGKLPFFFFFFFFFCARKTIIDHSTSRRSIEHSIIREKYHSFSTLCRGDSRANE